MADLNANRSEILYFQISSFQRPLIVFGILLGLSLYFNRASWEHLNAWEYLALGSLPIFLLVVFMLRGRMFLRFGDQYLTVHYITGTERNYAWTDMEKVGIVSFKRPAPSVALRLRDDSPSLSKQTKIYRAVTGYDVSIPPFFGPAKTLAARMEQIRLSKGAPIH